MKTKRFLGCRSLSRCCVAATLFSCLVLGLSVQPLRADSVPLDQDATVETHVTAGVWVYYEVEIPDDSPGWRLVLAPQGDSAGNVQLYVRKDSPPTTGAYFRRDNVAGTLKTMVLTAAEASEGTWYVGLYLASGSAEDVLLQSETGWLRELTWDPGNEELGTESWTVPGGDIGGWHYFRIVTPNSKHGLWRQVLEVTGGEADLYIRQNAAPTTSSYTARSIREGSDGILRALSTTSGAGQVWYIMVAAQPGSEWNLFAGDLFVMDLGDLQADGSGGSGADIMPIEGARFYQTAIPHGTLAWRLWLQDDEGGTWNNDLFIRKNVVGHPLITTPERTYTGQGLVVPPYLTTGTDDFFMSLNGDPGTEFALDSRQQVVSDLDFDDATDWVSADGYRFHTYRVVVPADLLGWEVTTRRDDGNPDLAIRRGQVPNARYNDAFSEVPGAADDSVTLVQPELGDGTFYITVYGSAPHAFSLENREPALSPIAFDDEVVNNDPDRTGWRYYGLTDIESQIGFLGWLIELSDQVPGTKIALRRNNLPGRWQFRNNNSLGSTSRVDHSSTVGILQRPGHEADVWYVGIRTADAALGAFILTTSPLTATTVSMDDFGTEVANLPPATFSYYRIDVPSQIGGQDVLGWELRVPEWSGARPQIYVRRDALPAVGAPALPSPNFQRQTAWGSGTQVDEQWYDWTGRHQSSDGTQNYTALALGFGMGQPLEPGTYYVGIRNTSTSDDSTFTWSSRAVGNEGSGLGYEVQPLAFGGSAATGTLAARDVVFFAVDIPEDTPSHKLRLDLPEGHEAQLYIRKDFLPNSKGSGAEWWDPTDPLVWNHQQTRLRREGGELFIHLPRADESTLRAGRYYLMVVSEGQNPESAARIGTGSVDFTLQSLGVAPVHNLGMLPVAGETELADGYEGGEVKLYRFAIPEDVVVLEVRLENRVGTPRLGLNAGDILRQQMSYWSGSTVNAYGLANARQTHYGAHDSILTVASPPAGDFSAGVFHGANTPVAGSYTLRVVTVGATPIPAASYSETVEDLEPSAWRYYRVEMPAQIGDEDVLGWEVRVSEWSGARPQLYIRRDEPPAVGAPGFPWPYFNRSTAWASGTQVDQQWYEWTGRHQSSDGSQNYAALALGFGMGQPLEPGTYYVGIRNTSTSDDSTFTWSSRAVGGAGSGLDYEVQPLAFGGAAATGTLAARDVAFFAVDIPEETPSHKLRLDLPAGHEAQLYIRKDFLPNSNASGTHWWDPSDSLHSSWQQTRLRREGGEFFVHLPRAGETSIRAGRYYVMVVSEGQNPASSSRIGTGSVDFTLQSLGIALVHNLGLLPVAGETQLADGYEGGEVKLYRFEVPEDVLALEVRLENRVGTPRLGMNAGQPLRQQMSYWSGGTVNAYGLANARETRYGVHDSILTVANPPAGDFSVGVFHGAGNPVAGSYTLRVVTVGATPIPAADFSETVEDLEPSAWRYYRIEMPAQIGDEDVLGWEVRVSEWSGARPHLYIRRDEPPAVGAPALPSPGFQRQTAWASGTQVDEQWSEWAGRHQSSDGSQNYEALALGFGMGQPLEPGTYYVGIRNTSDSLASTFTWSSRAIGGAGSGLGYEVQPMTFDGEVVGGTLDAREVAFFAMDLPEDTPSHRVRLDLPAGHEAQLYIRKDFLPNSKGSGVDWWDPSDPLEWNQQQTRLRRDGGEMFIHLPRAGETTIHAGRYYLMVVSEGQNPASSSRIGTGSVDFTLQSLGIAPVHNLGLLPVAGETQLADSYEGGEVKLYRFSIPEDVLALEVRLENRVGSPRLGLNAGNLLRQRLSYWSGGTVNAYGLANARQTHYGAHDSILTVTHPPSGDFSVGVFHGAHNPAEGAYTLKVTTLAPIDLEPAGSGSVSDALFLAPEQSRFFRIEVPEEWNEQDVLGWTLALNHESGSARVRARKDQLPSGSSNTGQTPWKAPSLLVVPPLLTPGTWYVEVQGVTDTEVSLSSSLLTIDDLQRIWTLPAKEEESTAPGMTGAWFGDSGIDEAGDPLPDDQGVDLASGRYHFYAVEVQEGNGALLRTVLETIGGNPDLYIRPALLPSLDHRATGPSGDVMYLHRLDGTTATEYGSWVPADVRSETQLQPGLWYLKVVAAGTGNARYRLRLSHHAEPRVQEIALDGGELGGQILANTDWRYYRVRMPENESDMPLEWTVSFGIVQGSVMLCIRDTIPPGQWERNANWSSNLRDWTSDTYNPGGYPRYTAPGSYTIEGRFLRPGKTYYLGFRASADAVFSVASNIGEETLGDVYGPIDIVSAAGGGASIELAPGEVRTWRVDSPAEATRWRHTSVHVGSVQVYLRENFVPRMDTTDLWRSNGAANSTRTAGYGTDLRPRTFYLSAHNTSAEPQTYTFTVEWRPEYTLSYLAGAGGAVDGATPQSVLHGESGTAVVATPQPGAVFHRWSDGIATAQRTDGNVQANQTVTARFRSVNGTDLDWYAARGIGPTGEETWGDVDAREVSAKGTTLRQENIGDTNPNNAGDLFRIISFDPGPPVTIQIQSGSSARIYTLMASECLLSGPWIPVPGAGPREGTGAGDTFSDTNHPPTGRFYRMNVELP